MKKGMCYLMSVCVVLLLSASIVEAIVITSLPYTITTKGFYTISNNLKSSGNGIVVNTDNVTIDLKGYTISGNGTGTYYGIYMNGRSNVEIRNGTIRYFGSHGIYEENVTSGNSHRVINVRVMNNKGEGVFLYGYNHIVKDCTASNNGGFGIYAGAGSSISGNTASNNGDFGIAGGGGSTVIGNTSYDNGGDGISADPGSTVKNNTAYRNQFYGIKPWGYNLVDGNTAYDNNRSGGSYTNMKSCASCVFGHNVAP